MQAIYLILKMSQFGLNNAPLYYSLNYAHTHTYTDIYVHNILGIEFILWRV